MTEWLASIWEMILGNGMVEPSTMIWIWFFIFFVFIPISVAIVSLKIIFWIFRSVRDWWHEGALDADSRNKQIKPTDNHSDRSPKV